MTNKDHIFIRPSSDGTYYGMVMSVRPSGSPSVRPSQFSALFSYMLWHIDLKFCVSLYFYARKIKFECHQFPSLFAGVMLLFNFKLLQICSFPHFSPTCFDILSSNFVFDFVLMYHRACLSVVILASIFVGVMPLCKLRILEIHSFPHFSLTCFDILSWNFAYDFVLLYYRSSSSVVNLRQCLWELCPFWNLEYWKYTVFPHFSLAPFNILSWMFAYYFVFLNYRSSLSVVNLRLFWSYASFRT